MFLPAFSAPNNDGQQTAPVVKKKGPENTLEEMQSEGQKQPWQESP
jgi:hypothetical protein